MKKTKEPGVYWNRNLKDIVNSEHQFKSQNQIWKVKVNSCKSVKSKSNIKSEWGIACSWGASASKNCFARVKNRILYSFLGKITLFCSCLQLYSKPARLYKSVRYRDAPVNKELCLAQNMFVCKFFFFLSIFSTISSFRLRKNAVNVGHLHRSPPLSVLQRPDTFEFLAYKNFKDLLNKVNTMHVEFQILQCNARKEMTFYIS